tara:strand:+ start:142 stop:321 length:180 start_codon:yes stop_codon:yes gene_type:complete
MLVEYVKQCMNLHTMKKFKGIMFYPALLVKITPFGVISAKTLPYGGNFYSHHNVGIPLQ